MSGSAFCYKSQALPCMQEHLRNLEKLLNDLRRSLVAIPGHLVSAKRRLAGFSCKSLQGEQAEEAEDRRCKARYLKIFRCGACLVI